MAKLTDKWQTPKDFRDWFIENYFLPDLDVAAERFNHFGVFYLHDGLKNDWVILGNKETEVWCNPPYSETGLWVDRAIHQHEKHPATTIIMLLKNDSSTKWFHKLIKAEANIIFLNPRIQFNPPEGLKKSSNAFSSILVELSPHSARYLDYKRWK